MGARISFDCEVKGEGDALGVAPEIGVLLKACKMSETIVGATSVTYAPHSLAIDDANNESVTIYYHQDLIRHELNGARGTWRMSGESGKQAILSLTFEGTYVSAVADTQSDITVNATIPPRLVSATFTIDSFAACVQAFGIDLGNQMVMKECINSATNGISHYGSTDRLPTMTINPETPAIATKDFWDKFENTSEMAVSMVIGQSSLNRATITIPKAVINASPNYTDRNGILTQDINLNLNYSAGDDEISILFD